MLLAHPDFAQVVFVIPLEMQRGHVVEHQRGSAGRADRVRAGGGGQHAAVVTGPRAGQRPEQGPHAHPGRADLLQHPYDLGLGRRLDNPRQDHRPESLIVKDVEPQPRVGADQYRPQQVSRGSHDPAAAARRRPPTRCPRQRQLARPCPVRDLAHPRRHLGHLAQVQDLLARSQPLPCRGQQQHQFGIGMRRPHVLDALNLPSAARDDLNRHRSRRSADLAHEPRDHPSRLARRSS